MRVIFETADGLRSQYEELPEKDLSSGMRYRRPLYHSPRFMKLGDDASHIMETKYREYQIHDFEKHGKERVAIFREVL